MGQRRRARARRATRHLEIHGRADDRRRRPLSRLQPAQELDHDGRTSFDEFSKPTGPQFAALMVSQAVLGVHVGTIDWKAAMDELNEERVPGTPYGYRTQDNS